MIRFNQVRFIRNERMILDQIQLEMKTGENWVLLGKNGSGKTTLLEMMNGYLFPSEGSVEVLGNMYGSCDVREVRKNIGYISQSLFDKFTLRDPVWEIVASGAYGYLRFYEKIEQVVIDKAVQMLEQVRLGHVKDQPLGSLSQGERKKVMLARVLMTNPKLIILDEPCSGLDLFEREQMLEVIRSIDQNNRQIIYVTHHIDEIIPVFTHVALIDQGKIVASGEKKQVLTDKNLQQVFQVPVTIEWHQKRPWIRV